MKQLNILICITTGVTGGAQNIVFTLAQGLLKKGYRVTIATGTSPLPNTLLLKANECGIATHEFMHLKRTYKPWYLFFFFIESFFYFRRNQFDCIHLHSSHTLFAAPAARLARHKTRLIFTFHGLSYLDPAHQRKKITRALISLTYAICTPFIDTFIFVSQKNRTDAIRHTLVHHALVIHNGIAPSFVSKEKAREALGLLPNEIIIGSIGRLDYPKNYEFLIRCIESIPHARLVLIGDGPERKRLEFLIRTAQLSDRCTLLGEREHAAMYVRAFDLFALPSRYEGLSLALIEAVMAGIPVLASDVGGNREVVHDSEEQLFTLGGNEEFIFKATKIITNPILQEQLSAINRTTGAQFTAEKMIDAHENVYQNQEKD